MHSRFLAIQRQLNPTNLIFNTYERHVPARVLAIHLAAFTATKTVL